MRFPGAIALGCTGSRLVRRHYLGLVPVPTGAVFGLTVVVPRPVCGVELGLVLGVNPLPTAPVVVPGDVRVVDGVPELVPAAPGDALFCVGVAPSGAMVVGATKPLAFPEPLTPTLPSVPEAVPAPAAFPVE